jgi:hypothetical protein
VTTEKVSCIQWDEDLALLGIGLEDGTIECLSLAPEHNFESYDEVSGFSSKLF